MVELMEQELSVGSLRELGMVKAMIMKVILLTEDELKQLLRGTLVWSDIAYKLNTSTGARSPVRSPEYSARHSDSVRTGASLARTPVGDDAELNEGRGLFDGSKEQESLSSPLSGKKVIFLLSGTGIAVAGLWLYFFIR